MKLSSIFLRCLNIDYIHVENSADYAYEIIDDALFLYFQDSDGQEDWKNNLDFPAKLNGTFFCHRGFLRVWKSILPYIEGLISDKRFKKIRITGYSHGGALALLCHEYSYSARPDIKENISSYAFGCPRVIWGFRTKKLKSCFKGFTVIRNIDDIVTHLPPALLGYKHVGNLLEIGEKDKYSKIDAHKPENILRELEKLSVRVI